MDTKQIVEFVAHTGFLGNVYNKRMYLHNPTNFVQEIISNLKDMSEIDPKSFNKLFLDIVKTITFTFEGGYYNDKNYPIIYNRQILDFMFTNSSNILTLKAKYVRWICYLFKNTKLYSIFNFITVNSANIMQI